MQRCNVKISKEILKSGNVHFRISEDDNIATEGFDFHLNSKICIREIDGKSMG